MFVSTLLLLSALDSCSGIGLDSYTYLLNPTIEDRRAAWDLQFL